MASKKEVKEVDYVSKQANLTAQIESERQAANKWWDEYGMCYLDDAKPEDFTYDNRIQVLKNKLAEEKFKKSAQHTTNSEYGCRPPFKECRKSSDAPPTSG